MFREPWFLLGLFFNADMGSIAVGRGENTMINLFENIPEAIDQEQFSDLLKHDGLRIERIVSQGQCSPEGSWYDLDENEWVLVLEGAGKLEFADGSEVTLNKGDHLNIPAHSRHRVSWTDPAQKTVWLAVFYAWKEPDASVL